LKVLNRRLLFITIALFSISLFWLACETDLAVQATDTLVDGEKYPLPTPYNFVVPNFFPQPKFPKDNPLTVQGVQLGRHLFYDPILSKEGQMNCAGCHAPNIAFSDVTATSIGVEGIAGTRNSMPLFNLAWTPQFLWDGSAVTLEEQILNPVRDPIEMHLNWKVAAEKLKAEPKYVVMFGKAFGANTPIDSTSTAKAIAQFLRTMVSASSKFDKALNAQETGVQLSDKELNGFDIFDKFPRGEFGHCQHCHKRPLFSEVNDYFRNNGLDAWETKEDLNDLGLGGHTGLDSDMGKFKAASLRNIELTGPYMHDGRFQTLEEVVDFYMFDVQQSPTLDRIMKTEFLNSGEPLLIQENAKEDLIAFLKTLTDWDFVNDTSFHSPF